MIGGRDERKLREAAEALREDGLVVEATEPDVTRVETVARAAAALEARYGRLNVLINNAGILPEAVAAA